MVMECPVTERSCAKCSVGSSISWVQLGRQLCNNIHKLEGLSAHCIVLPSQTRNMTRVSEIQSTNTRFWPIRGAPWWVLLQHSIILPVFLIVECGFCHGLHCWASRWRKTAYSLNHSPSTFDVPGTGALVLWNNQLNLMSSFHWHLPGGRYAIQRHDMANVGAVPCNTGWQKSKIVCHFTIPSRTNSKISLILLVTLVDNPTKFHENCSTGKQKDRVNYSDDKRTTFYLHKH